MQRIVHISVTQASIDSDLPYYYGKGIQESYLRESGVPFSIIRPTLVFGKEEILINNIAWMIRRFPVFPIFGSGDYRVQPVFVDDVARIAVQHSSSSSGTLVDAIGPETFTFEELARLIAQKIGRKVMFMEMPPGLGYYHGKSDRAIPAGCSAYGQ